MGKIHYLEGTVLDEDLRCSLVDMCRLCGVTAELLHEMIEEGVIHPIEPAPMEWRFTAVEIKRVQTALRLHHDLRVNLPGCALALDLLDELEDLKQRRRRR
ncbi:chaperone modulator CbpM [Desulfogranum japonicum]|uniref:chaperone modulator CbpM n=1 Tax=Desulfogranum japonicum TaxID=231447 RepID=UPI0004158CF3|nr:chaperone modulator CbpM [Desulfogranum japonicum]